MGDNPLPKTCGLSPPIGTQSPVYLLHKWKIGLKDSTGFITVNIREVGLKKKKGLYQTTFIHKIKYT